MNPKLNAWINYLSSCLTVGLISYQSVLHAGGSDKAAVIAGLIALLGAAQGHLRESPLEVANPPAPETTKPAVP